MNARRIAFFAFAVIIVLGLASWIAGSHRGDSSQSALLYPQLKSAVNSIDTIGIFKAGDVKAVELKRNDQGWTVSERAGYPADGVKVRKLLIDLQRAHAYEEKTSVPANYPQLNVEEVSDAEAKSVRVDLAGTPQPLSLIIGKSGAAGQSTYVRRAGEKQSWAIDIELQVASDPAAWLHREVIDVGADRIHEAVIVHNGAAFTANKQTRSDADFAVTGLAKGKELNSPSAPNAIATALTTLTLEDVRPAKDFVNDKPEQYATYKTFDGLIVDIDGWVTEDKRYIAIRTKYDPDLAEHFKPAAAEPAPAQKSKPADATTATPETASPETKSADTKSSDASADALKLNQQLDGWVFQIAQFKYDAIFPKLDLWLKKPPVKAGTTPLLPGAKSKS